MDTCPRGTRNTITSYHTSQTVKNAGQGCKSAAHLKPKTAYSLQLDQLSLFCHFTVPISCLFSFTAKTQFTKSFDSLLQMSFVSFIFQFHKGKGIGESYTRKVRELNWAYLLYINRQDSKGTHQERKTKRWFQRRKKRRLERVKVQQWVKTRNCTGLGKGPLHTREEKWYDVLVTEQQWHIGEMTVHIKIKTRMRKD